MKKIFIGLGVLVAAIVITVVVLNQPVQQQGSVVLGVIAGTTGDYAAAGEGYLTGFELAKEEWNSSHTQQFVDVIEDDGFNAKKGVAAYQKIKSVDKPAAYAVVSSFTIDAIMGDLHSEKLPVALGFEQSTPAIDDNIFQVLPAARPIQKGLGAHLKELGYKKPLVVFSNNTPVYANFLAGFVDGYGTGVMQEQIGAEKTAVHGLATKILARKPDVIIFYTDPPTGALLAKEIIVQSGGKQPQLAFDQSIQSGITDYKSVFGNTLGSLDGSIIALSKNDLTADFKTLYKQKYNVEPPFGADMGYNAFMLLATTYANSPQAWITNMKKAKFTGADGTVLFDNTGLRVPNLAFATLQKGEVVVR